jgi:DNA sulfur modification protein DndB
MKNPNIETGRLNISYHENYEQATRVAYDEASNTAGWTFPVVVFQQGKRMFLSGAFPIGFVESRLFSRSAVKGTNIEGASTSLNRPIDTKHTKVIARYLEENVNTKYIVPPLTLNVQEQVSLHTISTGTTFKAGYLVIPSGVNLAITDGQHRVQGIISALDEISSHDSNLAAKLRQDSIAVMITCEHETKQIHQDFADCSKTKALPPSLLSVYDTRNPGNRLVFDLEQNCLLFKGRIDSTSKTLSKKSVYLFLANQVRQLIKHLLLKRNLADADFEKYAKEHLGKEEYKKYLKNYVEYINYVTNVIPVLKQIAKLPLDSPEKGQIPKFRSDGWICLTATGLNVIGCIGYELFTNGIEDWQSFVDKFADIDWKRTGDIWQGNIIQDLRLVTQAAPVKKAVDILVEKIGLKKEIEKKQIY